MSNPYAATYPLNKSFDISSNPGADNQVKLLDESGNSVVTFQTGMNSVYDMRFCDNEDNELYFWVESTSGAIETEDFSAVVWVKLVSGTATKVIFNYGNESATDGSSGDNTFEFFDDAETGSIGDKWQLLSGTEDWAYSETIAKTGTKSVLLKGTNLYYTAKNLSISDLILDTDLIFTTSVENAFLTVCASTSQITCYAHRNRQGTVETSKFVNNVYTSLETSTASDPDQTTWQHYQIKRSGTNMKLYLDGELATEYTSCDLAAGSIGIKTGSTGCGAYLDIIRVRKYIETEPYFTLSETPSTLNPTLIYFDEDNEMKQFVGTSRKHPVAAYNDSTGAPVNSLTSPTFYVSVNGENRQTLELTISEFDALHQWFWLTVPGTLGTITPVDGDEISITFGDGTASGFAMVQFEAVRATAAALTTVDGKIDDIPTNSELATALEGIEVTGTGGGGLVIASGQYSFDATEKTITLTDTTITLEQIQEIRNLTRNKMVIYDCTNAYTSITLESGVITYTQDFPTFADTDILQIVVNSV